MAVSLALCTVGAHYVGRTMGHEQAVWGGVVAAFTFLYTSTFGATWVSISPHLILLRSRSRERGPRRKAYEMLVPGE